MQPESLIKLAPLPSCDPATFQDLWDSQAVAYV